MNEELDKNIQEQFNSLPPELQKAISAVDLPEKLQQITVKNKLLIDKAGGVQTETLMVLLGINPLDDFIGNLQKNVGLDKNQALAVAHDVDELVFKGVRDALKTVSRQMAAEETAEVAGGNVPETPQKETVLAGIEAPQNAAQSEPSVSMSALPSNNAAAPAEAAGITLDKGVEIRPDILPEVEPAGIPVEAVKKPAPFSPNISPVQNIVETKMTEEVAVPKKEVIIEEKTKLPGLPVQPEKTRPSSGDDPYREPVE